MKQNVPKFGLDFHIEYDTGKKVQKQMSKAEEQFHNNTKSACSQQPRLLPILGSENSTLELAHSVLMMETSGRGRLTGRQACAVESAARRFQEQKHKSFIVYIFFDYTSFRSGMAVNVVLLSPQLNLTDNTTCQLVNSGLNINFFTIDIESITEDTPLGNNIVNVNIQK